MIRTARTLALAAPARGLTLALALATILGLAAGPAVTPALACPADGEQDCGHARQGWFAGLDLGAGSAKLEYEQDGTGFESDDTTALGVTLRVGYQFSRCFALTLDTRGVGREDDGQELAIGSTVLMAKLHPGGRGFFIRGGLGRGCITTEFDADADDAADQAELPDLDDEHALILAFGVGYEWMVSDSFSLGLAFDARGAELDDQDDLTDIKFGESTLGVTMNWFF